VGLPVRENRTSKAAQVTVTEPVDQDLGVQQWEGGIIGNSRRATKGLAIGVIDQRTISDADATTAPRDEVNDPRWRRKGPRAEARRADDRRTM